MTIAEILTRGGHRDLRGYLLQPSRTSRGGTGTSSKPKKTFNPFCLAYKMCRNKMEHSQSMIAPTRVPSHGKKPPPATINHTLLYL